MAGGKYRSSIHKLAKRRDSLMRKANEYFKKMRRLEAEAEKLDEYITNNCTHPREYLKLKQFTKEIPQKSIWLCKLCFQGVEVGCSKNKKEVESNIEATFEDVFNEIPTEAIRKDNKRKEEK